MANRIDFTTIEVPAGLRDRIARIRSHPKQPFHEVVEDAIDLLEDLQGRPALTVENLLEGQVALGQEAVRLSPASQARRRGSWRPPSRRGGWQIG